MSKRRGRRDPVSLEALAGDLVRHMRSAGRLYERMSGGWAAWYAPESFFRDYVAQTLHRSGISSTPEVMVGDLRRFLRVSVRGRPPTGKQTRRVDLVVWNQDQTPRAVIEFKRKVSPEILRNDAHRLRAIANWSSHPPKYALIAAFGNADEDDSLEVAAKRVVKVLHVKEVDRCLAGAGWNVRPWDVQQRMRYSVFRVD